MALHRFRRHTTFSAFLPTLDVPMATWAISTVGIYKETREPVTLPKRQMTK